MILIAVGANLPGLDGRPPMTTCRDAIAEVTTVRGLQFVVLSSWYRTTPVPPSGQPDYVNAVARFRGEADPATLLARLHEIEERHGRRRTEVNGARTLDLDIVAIGGTVRAAPDPVLPHPRAHLRAFVLRPLAEVAPEWVHPLSGQTAAAMLSALPAEATGAGAITLLTDPG